MGVDRVAVVVRFSASVTFSDGMAVVMVPFPFGGVALFVVRASVVRNTAVVAVRIPDGLTTADPSGMLGPMETLSPLQALVIGAFGVTDLEWRLQSNGGSYDTIVRADSSELPAVVRRGAEIMRKLAEKGGTCVFRRVLHSEGSFIIFSVTASWGEYFATVCYSIPVSDRRKITVSSRGRQFFAKGAILGPEVHGLRAVRREFRAIWES